MVDMFTYSMQLSVCRSVCVDNISVGINTLDYRQGVASSERES